uniref:Uncharacterized protein n=1 Tax=Craspedostauros australis TaxID=1486917 RepID=A0A7R9WZB9_9STRA
MVVCFFFVSLRPAMLVVRNTDVVSRHAETSSPGRHIMAFDIDWQRQPKKDKHTTQISTTLCTVLFLAVGFFEKDRARFHRERPAFQFPGCGRSRVLDHL